MSELLALQNEIQICALEISQVSESLGKAKIQSPHFNDTSRYLQRLIKRYFDLTYKLKGMKQ